MALPVFTSAEDVRDVVRYLKTKPTGATLAEMKSAVRKEVTDWRKMSAFQNWGFVTREGERYKLTTRAWDLARKPETESAVFTAVIDSIAPYRSVLEWAFHQNLESVTNVDVAAHWHEHHTDALGTENETTIKDAAVCFFHIVQAAGLGKLVMGRKGQSTRVDLERQVLTKFVEAGPSTPPWESTATGEVASAEVRADLPIQPSAPASATAAPPGAAEPEKMTVFISHGKNLDIVEQVQTMLELGGFGSEVAENEETSAIPVPEKVFSSMRKCQAGIIAVTVDEGIKDDKGQFALNDNVLIEIGAAFVLYDRRVVLLWDRRLTVPSNLQGLYRCEFEGSELSWSTGMKLMKAIQGFKRPQIG